MATVWNIYAGGNSIGNGTDMDIAMVKYNAAGVQQWVAIKVFNIPGKEMTTLLNAVRKAGHYSSELNVSMLPKGLYLYRVIFNAPGKTWVETGKISVLR